MFQDLTKYNYAPLILLIMLVIMIFGFIGEIVFIINKKISIDEYIDDYTTINENNYFDFLNNKFILVLYVAVHILVVFCLFLFTYFN